MPPSASTTVSRSSTSWWRTTAPTRPSRSLPCLPSRPSRPASASAARSSRSQPARRSSVPTAWCGAPPPDRGARASPCRFAPDMVDDVHYFMRGVRTMPALVDQVRAFNREWTEVLGLLDEGLLATEHTLAEARVIYELAQRPSWERLELRRRLGMDASFLTRVLSRLEAKG